MNARVFPLLVALAAGFPAKAQVRPLWNAFPDHVLAWNPAAAGSHDGVSLAAFYRRQWTEIPDGPGTASLSVHAPLWNPRLALGGTLDHDRLGPLRRSTLRGHFAWRAVGRAGTFSLGVAAGATLEDGDFAALDAGQAGDPAFLVAPGDRWGWDAGAGAFWYGRSIMLGVSALDLAGERRYRAGAAALLRYGQGHGLRPFALLRYPEAGEPLADLGLRLLFAESFWVGGLWRTNRAWSVEMLYALRGPTAFGWGEWGLGYAYQVPEPEARGAFGGTHEVQVRYRFHRDRTREWTPRFF